MNKEDINVVLKALGYYKLKNPKDEDKINKVMNEVSNLLNKTNSKISFTINDSTLTDREKKYYSYFDSFEEAEQFREKLLQILLDAYPDGVTIPEILTFAPYPLKVKNGVKYKAHIVFPSILLDRLHEKLPPAQKELDKNR
jgi:hypothetical protein